MKSASINSVGGIAVFLLVLFAAQLVGQAQSPRPQNGAQQNSSSMSAPANKPAAASPAAQSASAQSIDAQREQIWNSPNMLRARAWLQEYCERSAKITPAEKQQYMTELQNLSPIQMKLWLLKFDEQEEARQQQQAFFEQARSGALARAKSADAATQQAYAAINRGETAAANNAEQQLNTQSADQQSAEQTKQLENAGPYQQYGPYGYGNYGIHYHFYGNPY
jgi:hypothetical protein